jgi:N-acyl amino acid synthase of PEP-CTERM/exosortase system
MAAEASGDFAAVYDRYFTVIGADTPELLDLAYRLRYQVYCIENGFEDPARCSDHREVDDDDDRSAHVLLVHRRSGAVAGTARIILPLPGDTHRPLPIERFLNPADRLVFHTFPPNRTAEVSRFAVSKEFRRRRGEEVYADACVSGPVDGAVTGERRLMPYVTFGLLRGILGMCLEHGITHLAALMEPALVRILTRLGIHFERLGGLVEHRRMRQPCAACLADLVEQSRSNCGPLWQYARAEIDQTNQFSKLPVSDLLQAEIRGWPASG